MNNVKYIDYLFEETYKGKKFDILMEQDETNVNSNVMVIISCQLALK